MFDEYDEKGRDIMSGFEHCLEELEIVFDISFKEPPHDIARRFLNEIVEFVSIDKGGIGE